jgi:hypothetical protein
MLAGQEQGCRWEGSWGGTTKGRPRLNKRIVAWRLSRRQMAPNILVHGISTQSKPGRDSVCRYAPCRHARAPYSSRVFPEADWFEVNHFVRPTAKRRHHVGREATTCCRRISLRGARAGGSRRERIPSRRPDCARTSISAHRTPGDDRQEWTACQRSGFLSHSQPLLVYTMSTSALKTFVRHP